MEEWISGVSITFQNANAPCILVSLHVVTPLSMGWGTRLCGKATVSQRVSWFIPIILHRSVEKRRLLSSRPSKEMRGKIARGCYEGKEIHFWEGKWDMFFLVELWHWEDWNAFGSGHTRHFHMYSWKPERLPDLDGYTASLKGQLSLCSNIQDILPPTVMEHTWVVSGITLMAVLHGLLCLL